MDPIFAATRAEHEIEGDPLSSLTMPLKLGALVLTAEQEMQIIEAALKLPSHAWSMKFEICSESYYETATARHKPKYSLENDFNSSSNYVDSFVSDLLTGPRQRSLSQHVRHEVCHFRSNVEGAVVDLMHRTTSIHPHREVERFYDSLTGSIRLTVDGQNSVGQSGHTLAESITRSLLHHLKQLMRETPEKVEARRQTWHSHEEFVDGRQLTECEIAPHFQYVRHF